MPELTRKEAVARGASEAVESLVASLKRRGIAAERVDSGPFPSVWVDPDRAEEVRRLAADHGGHLQPVSGEESAYEFCLRCGYYHGPGATRCLRCGEYVRP
jgi:ribosomal protein L40E